jgi:hypothetical protein
MKKLFVAAALSAALTVGAASAWAAEAMKPLTADSTMGELTANPKAKDVLNKYIPEIVANPQMEQAKAMTLRSLQQYAPNITDDLLKKIDADLAKIK